MARVAGGFSLLTPACLWCLRGSACWARQSKNWN